MENMEENILDTKNNFTETLQNFHYDTQIYRN